MADQLEVYVPVCVVVEDGNVIGAYLDWEGQPWSTDEPNIWDPQKEDWFRREYDDDDEPHPYDAAEDTALTRIGIVLRDAFPRPGDQLNR